MPAMLLGQQESQGVMNRQGGTVQHMPVTVFCIVAEEVLYTGSVGWRVWEGTAANLPGVGGGGLHMQTLTHEHIACGVACFCGTPVSANKSKPRYVQM